MKVIDCQRQWINLDDRMNMLIEMTIFWNNVISESQELSACQPTNSRSFNKNKKKCIDSFQ